jgi:hypothetical protein
MSEEEYSQWLKEFYVENGPKPDCYDFQDFIEDDSFNAY